MSNGHGLIAQNFHEALPQVLKRDESTDALAAAASRILEEHAAELRTVALYPLIDSLPEGLLDILARDFKVDWYDFAQSLEAKRNTIKTHWSVHRRLGTVGAVRTAIQAIYPEVVIQEWFDYEGDPYHFKLHVEIPGSDISPDLHAQLLNALEYYKPVRAVLDGIDYYRERKLEQTLYFGLALVAARHMEIGCNIPPEFDTGYLTDAQGNLLLDGLGNRLVD